MMSLTASWPRPGQVGAQRTKAVVCASPMASSCRSAGGLDAADPRDRGHLAPGVIALLAQPPARRQQAGDAVLAAERGLDRVLRRDVGAQPQVGQQLQALQVVGRVAARAGDHQPARAEPGQPVGLRQPARRTSLPSR